MRWLWIFILFIFLQQPASAKDFIEHVTYNTDPIPGTIRLRYNGWRGVLVRETRRQLYNLWLDTIELRTDGGLDGRKNRLIMEMQLSRGDNDMLGFYWQRRFWDMNKPHLYSLEVGGSPRTIDFGVVKINPDWQVKWKEWSGEIEDSKWSWKFSPQASLGLTGINSIGSNLTLRYGQTIEFSLNGGWNKRRGFECLLGIEIWRI